MLEMVGKIMERFDGLEEKLKSKASTDTVDKLEVRLKQVEDKMILLSSGENKDPNPCWGDEKEEVVMVKAVEMALSKQVQEDKNINSRRNNVILYRVPELDDKNYDVRLRHDRGFLNELCSKAFHVELEDDDVGNMFRLGKKQEGETARPLLVSFNGDEKKLSIMNNLQKLKFADDRFRFVGIAHDLTVKQRDDAKRLVDDAKKIQDDSGETSENYKFFVVDHFTKPRVIRLKKH